MKPGNRLRNCPHIIYQPPSRRCLPCLGDEVHEELTLFGQRGYDVAIGEFGGFEADVAFVIRLDEQLGELCEGIIRREAHTADVGDMSEAVFDQGKVRLDALAFEIGVV
ncbi:MAG: hypothetical protein ACK56I_35115, partial [bacterium]